jgi:RNA-directed DNA polymerase
LTEIRGHLQAGYQAVYDADLKGYFDSIPHDKLLACLRMRITDRSVLHLIRCWLEAPVEEPPATPGGGKRTTRPPSGTPQGGVISPLLANIFLHYALDAWMSTEGHVLILDEDEFEALQLDEKLKSGALNGLKELKAVFLNDKPPS